MRERPDGYGSGERVGRQGRARQAARGSWQQPREREEKCVRKCAGVREKCAKTQNVATVLQTVTH